MALRLRRLMCYMMVTRCLPRASDLRAHRTNREVSCTSHGVRLLISGGWGRDPLKVRALTRRDAACESRGEQQSDRRRHNEAKHDTGIRCGRPYGQ